MTPDPARLQGPAAASMERTLAVVFRAGSDLYALSALDVSKVVEPGRIGSLPRLPAPILGITHHRGRVITVVDLACLLEGKPREGGAQPSSRLLILDRGQRNIGLFVDSVEEIGWVRVQKAAGGGPQVVQYQGAALTVLRTDSLLERIYALIREEGA